MSWAMAAASGSSHTVTMASGRAAAPSSRCRPSVRLRSARREHRGRSTELRIEKSVATDLGRPTRFAIVELSHIVVVEPASRAEYEVVLDDGSDLPCSRSYCGRGTGERMQSEQNRLQELPERWSAKRKAKVVMRLELAELLLDFGSVTQVVKRCEVR